MNNQMETVKVEGGKVTFDWATGTMTATWDNGGTETWTRRGHSVAACAESYLRFTDQLDRLAMIEK